MGASLLIKLGPYAVIGILMVLLGIDHYRLIACDSQRQAAQAANHAFQADTKTANAAILKAHSDLVSERSVEALLQKKIDETQAASKVSVRQQLAHPPVGDCNQLMANMAETLGAIK